MRKKKERREKQRKRTKAYIVLYRRRVYIITMTLRLKRQG